MSKTIFFYLSLLLFYIIRRHSTSQGSKKGPPFLRAFLVSCDSFRFLSRGVLLSQFYTFRFAFLTSSFLFDLSSTFLPSGFHFRTYLPAFSFSSPSTFLTTPFTHCSPSLPSRTSPVVKMVRICQPPEDGKRAFRSSSV